MADISQIKLPDNSVYDIKDTVARTVMTGATDSANGAQGQVPAPTTADAEKFLRGDGTWQDGGRPMVILSYGSSTWQDFINAYNNHVIVYCKASSNANPASGSQTRMAFMAYVNADPPTQVEFQYYRSVSSHSNDQQGDQVFIYLLKNTGAWSVTTREASSKIVAGTGLASSYSSGTLTLTANVSPMTGAASDEAGTAGLVPAPAAGDESKYLRGDGTWQTVSAGSTYTAFTGATSIVAGAAGLVPQPLAGDDIKVLCGDGTWVDTATDADIDAIFTANYMAAGQYF